MKIKPFSLKNAPSLIERTFPAQKISLESYKEQMAGAGKTLTALGSYWKGRKPLILNRACILGALLPATNDSEQDLAIFDMLMGIDETSMKKRLKNKKANPKTFSEWVEHSERAENCDPIHLHAHIWSKVNQHLGTHAFSIPELIEQLGIMRFGHRPKVCDPFSGSGQIPFEAARTGCDTYASDLNPIACMLTWGSFHMIGATEEARKNMIEVRHRLIQKVETEMDALGFEKDARGRRAKNYLYCCECICPVTGWKVPMMPSFIISGKRKVVARLISDPKKKRYKIDIVSGVSDAEMIRAKQGTVREGKLFHPQLEEPGQARKIASIRDSGPNSLRRWEKSDIIFRKDDVFQERLYCIQWQNKDGSTEFSPVTLKDEEREQEVIDYVSRNLSRWQVKGWIPEDEIRTGYNNEQPIRERGWTYWHHLFNPRQLLLLSLVNRHADASAKVGMGPILNYGSRLCCWHIGRDTSEMTFSNQALNTLWNYSCRGSIHLLPLLEYDYKTFPLLSCVNLSIGNHPANKTPHSHDLIITDPPYGDAVKYEEITEFFIAWLRKNPPKEFADWIWDSRRALAIKGEDHEFKTVMIDSFSHLASCMNENGLQVLMFTHQSNAIWADLAQILWASGLRVTAAWYVATETASGLKKGGYVTGTILLILRKRTAKNSAFSDEVADEIRKEVGEQHALLTNLNQKVKKPEYRDENLFSDADLKMAGYAAALRVLTRYEEIDGKNMEREARLPRKKGETSTAERLIKWAAELADTLLVPEDLSDPVWKNLNSSERFYLKMLDQEYQGLNSLDNYQTFAKSYRCPDFKSMMANLKPNQARLKSSSELGKGQLTGEKEFDSSPLRYILYALWQLEREVPESKVLKELAGMVGIGSYIPNRPLLREIAVFLAKRLEQLRPGEAQQARILANLIANERVG
ncbi:MAG: DUF1156 domain-containing protein [Verrucomicrobia bacterium]|nr:DUF1156 domain-containing protein [Verrucomicrobiota bacterium]